ncbi:hypothetical protein A1O7_01090 [Cladophialophora yegresii CBS 114405]|uniref:Uncharacterized protein n=1 Tax=Cladophialophora yegresii CBS 114405 TaxID=1182544 RepID=W9W9G4_9EURO|nr:uncharacterized protein A1O7_01090 [Cladophialophora yegresii CBS 114405]EXJ64752.1 hypothetical protein A1O7_01090 [Cladophialophora yegresii CBS 114405]
MVFVPSPDQGVIETIGWRGGRLEFEQRRLVRLSAEAAGALLFAFCVGLAAPDGMSPGELRHVCGILQQLLRAFDGKGVFARDRLPLGIQGVKELDWTKQNDQFSPLREEHRAKGKEPEHENQYHTWTGPKGNKYTLHGCHDEDLVIVDESLKEAGLFKLVCHSFDVPGMSQVKSSWQVFAKLDHPEFAALCPGYTETEFQAYGTLVLASLNLFSECRSAHEQLCRLGEGRMLQQEIRRGEFLGLTTIASETVAESSHRSDEKNLPAGCDSDSFADPDSQVQEENTRARSSSQISSSSTLDAMDAPPIEEATANNHETSMKAKKPKKKKKKKPKKQAATQSSTPSEGSELPPAEREPGLPVDDMPSSIAPKLPFIPSSLKVSSSAQHQAQANDGAPTSVDQKVSHLAGDIAKMRLPTRPTIPLPPKPPPSAVSPGGPYKGSQYSRDKDLRKNEDRTAFSNVPNKSTLQSTSSSGPPMPTPPTTRQQTQEESSGTGAAASTPENLSKKEIADASEKPNTVAVSKPCVDKRASGRETDIPSSASSQVGPHPSNDALDVKSATGEVQGKQPAKDRDINQKTEEAQGKGPEGVRMVESRIKKEGVTNPHRHSLGPYATSNPAPPQPEFKFDGFHPLLKCPKPDCRAMTSCWDRNVVICPACGTSSFTRYCKKQHLYDDMQRHWVLECRQRKITGPIDQDTIRPYQIPKRPYVMGQMPNLIERHRQAVYRAMDEADYFIFADLDEIDPSIAEPTPAQWNAVRGTGKLAVQVKFELNESLGCEARLFQYHIQRILAVGRPAALDSCNRAMIMIRNALIRSGNWTEDVLTYLCMQLPGEWGGYKVPDSFYNVAEVNAMWNLQRTLPAI